MKIMITGASGFIGQALIKYLLSRNYSVLSLSRKKTSYNIVHIPVANYSAKELAHALVGVEFDVLIHLVGAGSIPEDRNILTLTEVNAILPGVMVEAAERCNAKAVLIAGSYAEYKEPLIHEKLTEHHALQDNDIYGSSKAAGSSFALSQGEFYNIPVAVARLFNIYGHGDTLRHRLFPSIVDRLKQGREVQLSSGIQERDFIHIDDVCSAFEHMTTALVRGILPAGPYNVASGVACSVKNFACSTAKALNADPNLLKFGAITPRTVLDNSYMVGDPSLLEHYLSWTPQLTIEHGLQKSVEDMLGE